MFQFLLTLSTFLSPSERAPEVCPCEIILEATQQEIDAMYRVAYDESGDRTVLVGLAAPQIGIQKRIILVDIAATGISTTESKLPPPNIKEFINPEILWRSESQSLAKVLIKAYDRQGNIITREYEGYVARIFQDEIDHLDGIQSPE